MYKKITIYVKLPDDYIESDVDQALSETIQDFDGKVVEILDYEDTNLYP